MFFKFIALASVCIASQVNGSSLLFIEGREAPRRTRKGHGRLELFVIKVVVDECSEMQLPMYANAEHAQGDYGRIVPFFPTVCFSFNESKNFYITEGPGAPETCSYPLPSPEDNASSLENDIVEAVSCKYAEAFVYHVSLAREPHQVSGTWVTRKASTSRYRRWLVTAIWLRYHISLKFSMGDDVDHATESEMPDFLYNSILTEGESVIDVVDGVYGRLVEQDTRSLGQLAYNRRLLTWLPESKGHGIDNSGFRWLGNKNLGVYTIQFDPFYYESLGHVVIPFIPTNGTS